MTTNRPAIPPQYPLWKILAVWAAAALPMGIGAWVIAPAIGGHAAPTGHFAETLIGVFTAGLIWQFILVVLLVAHENRRYGRRPLRDTLWLAPPSNDQRRGGRLWLWAPALIGVFALAEVIPLAPDPPAARDFGTFLSSHAGRATVHGNWGLFATIVVLAVFNTVLGEELLFRGLLLPRMSGTFGRADGLVNGLLFGLYHLHQPWSMPGAFLTGAAAAHASSRMRSAWLGIIAHSAQSVFFIVIGLLLVL